MQIAQNGNPENIELHGKLRLGGVWYFRGDNVSVSPEDAAVLRMRGLAAHSKPGVQAKNIIRVPGAVAVTETVPAAEIGIVTSNADKGKNYGVAGKRR